MIGTLTVPTINMRDWGKYRLTYHRILLYVKNRVTTRVLSLPSVWMTIDSSVPGYGCLSSCCQNFQISDLSPGPGHLGLWLGSHMNNPWLPVRPFCNPHGIGIKRNLAGMIQTCCLIFIGQGKIWKKVPRAIVAGSVADVWKRTAATSAMLNNWFMPKDFEEYKCEAERCMPTAAEFVRLDHLPHADEYSV
jgi:hypothetical protein